MISVIVPVYCVEKYIRRCIDSILNQTYDNFDLILVDDGSPDNCGSICEQYALVDNRVVVIHQKNGGLSLARNTGIDWAIANSNSEWLAFVDSDDWIHPRFLEFLLSAVGSDKTKLSVCNFIKKFEYTNDFTDVVFDSRKVKGMDVFESNLNIEATVAWNKLYSKDLFCDLRYPIGRLHEDEFLTYKLLFRADYVSWVDASLYFYYQNPNGIIHSAWSLRRLDVYDAYEERIDFLFEEGQNDYYKYELRRLFTTYFVFFADSVGKLEGESRYARKFTSIRLRKSIKKYNKQVKGVLSFYDMFSALCLAYGNYWIQKWIVKNDFEPLQNIIRKIKQIR